jgi:DNA recombination protein RmuC
MQNAPAFAGAAFVVGALIAGLLLWVLSTLPTRRHAAAAENRVRTLEIDLANEQNERQELAVDKAKLEATAERLPSLETTIAQLRAELATANAKLTEAGTALEGERTAHAARLEELGRMGEEIERKFVVLAAEALGKNAENFLTLVNERFAQHRVTADKDLEARRAAIENLIKPLAENLGKFDRQISEIEKERVGAYQAITEQVRALGESQIQLRTETGRLVQALRTPKTRGLWGELQLRKVLELAGMTENVDFVEQPTLRSSDSDVLRPDVILQLPGGKSIIVDAKTPLDAYLAALEASDEASRDTLMAQHSRQLRDHVKALGGKDYWKSLPGTPDLVVMFVPGEPFFVAAMERDPSLFEQALRQKVMVATPMTFIALVKAIAYGWQQENVTRNAQAVAELARELYERIKTFGEHVAILGSAIRQSVERYNRAVGSLEGRVLPCARRFEALGVVPVGTAMPELMQVEVEPRQVQAAELLSGLNYEIDRERSLGSRNGT